MLHPDSDIKNLFRQISNGDKAAFDQLFRSQYDNLVRFAGNFIADAAVAEELVSDVFVAIWLNRENLPKVENATTYLFVSVKNRCYNALRSKTHTVSIEEQNEISKPEYENPHREMENRELHEKLNQLIDRLPEQQRLIFRMIKGNGLSAKQCAQILNLSARTVETHLYKAVKQLEKAITDYLGYSPKKKQMEKLISITLF